MKYLFTIIGRSKIARRPEREERAGSSAGRLRSRTTVRRASQVAALPPRPVNCASLRWTWFTLVPLALLLLSGCSIEERIERREDRLRGTWIIEKASFNEDGALFNDNITDEFAGDRITFYRNGEVEYLTGDGQFFVGTWFIDALRDLDDDLEFTLDADFFDASGFLAFRWIGTIDRLTENNFNINIAEVDGILRLKWDKL